MIRPFGLRDVLAVRQLQPRGVAFDLRRLLLRPSWPSRAAILGYLTRHHFGPLTYIEENDAGRPVGFVQVWRRANAAEWDVAYIAPSFDYARTTADLWLRLLTQLVAAGGERHVSRLYARLAEDWEIEAVLRQAGFTAMVREEVFVLTRQAAPAPAPRGLRPAEAQDLPALEALYAQVVPQLLHQVEVLSPQRNMALSWLRRLWMEEYIWAEKGRALAYFWLMGSPRGYWLEMLVRPECRAESQSYLRYLLTRMPCSDAKPIYASVPDYSVGLAWVLRTLGFESYHRQVLMVAHTMARARVRRPLLATRIEDISTSIGHVPSSIQTLPHLCRPNETL